MDFADAGADAGGGFDLGQFGVDEHAGDDAGVGQTCHNVPQAGFLGRYVEAALGRDLVAPSGTSMAISGLRAAGDADHFVGGGHFQIELDLGEIAQAPHVGILDVAPVFPHDGDAVGAPRCASTAAQTGSGS